MDVVQQQPKVYASRLGATKAQREGPEYKKFATEAQEGSEIQQQHVKQFNQRYASEGVYQDNNIM